MTDHMITWLRDSLTADSIRLTALASGRAGTGRSDDRLIVRIAMDQAATIAAQMKVIEIAEQAIANEVAVSQFQQAMRWMAYQRQGEGYLETWAPDGVDLVAMLADFDLGEEDNDADTAADPEK
ncbi:hypothetical protein [Actinoplanes sp. L3-i22]|uniref:hypothetical protein n=1 Tax=Actinoplanes sp. L3-i22 TaxID=2836373 RepID=UPI001C75DE30|nr:hypothetical protein [Actinoplanes sp. L3-i22]BCY10990.1 hypothetical protein L3i22_060780 [Actinoplanes sp. L3-i22]